MREKTDDLRRRGENAYVRDRRDIRKLIEKARGPSQHSQTTERPGWRNGAKIKA